MLSESSTSYAIRTIIKSGLLLAAIAFGVTATDAQTATTQQPPLSSAAQSGNTNSTNTVPATKLIVIEPVYKDYRGVTIGMDAAEARSKLGDKKAKGQTQDYFALSNNETVTLYYDKAGKVRAISAIYAGKKDAPTDVAVLGEAVAPNVKGRVYKMVRYPQAGYWVAYSRTAGDSPVVVITMQKMRTSAGQSAKQ